MCLLVFFFMKRRPPRSTLPDTLLPYTTRVRSASRRRDNIGMSEDPASPVCYAVQAEDAYMGYADRDELLDALNELIEAERAGARVALKSCKAAADPRSEEHTSELQSLMRISYAVFCLKKKNKQNSDTTQLITNPT